MDQAPRATRASSTGRHPQAGQARAAVAARIGLSRWASAMED